MTRTPDQSAAATYWVGASGSGVWLRTAINAATASGSSTLENATLFARMNVAMADATIGIFDAKYYYDYWRPVTAIRAAGLDGNPDTLQDASWTPYVVTPPHPSYISGHSGISSSAAAILADAFGDTGSFCTTWLSTSRCWANYSAAADDAANSRLWGGIHWSFDKAAGLALGRSSAEWTLESQAFAMVPEPGTWALLIAGFGLVGSKARRRRATAMHIA